jgi:hypothetical protein
MITVIAYIAEQQTSNFLSYCFMYIYWHQFSWNGCTDKIPQAIELTVEFHTQIKTYRGSIKIFHRILNKSDKPLQTKLDKNRMGSNSRQKGYYIGVESL